MPSVMQKIEYGPIMDFLTTTVDEHFFLKERVDPIKVLEVGCGPGDLTSIFKSHYKEKVIITAIDPCSKDIETAKKNVTEDIDFQLSGIFDWKTDEKYDLIFFSKSLHHCIPVDKALQITHSLMADNGIVICEEVFPDDMNSESISWFLDRLDLITKCGLIKPREHHHHHHNHGPSEWRTKLTNENLPHKDRWFSFDHPDLVPSAVVKNAIHAEFGESNVKLRRNIPFCFHFILLLGLDDTDNGRAVFEEFIAQEKRAIQDGTIKALGGNYIIYK